MKKAILIILLGNLIFSCSKQSSSDTRRYQEDFFKKPKENISEEKSLKSFHEIKKQVSDIMEDELQTLLYKFTFIEGIKNSLNGTHYKVLKIHKTKALKIINKALETLSAMAYSEIRNSIDEIYRKNDVDSEEELKSLFEKIIDYREYEVLSESLYQEFVSSLKRWSKKFYNRLKGPLFQKCKNGKTQLWANIQLESDLALKFLQKKRIGTQNVKIAVIDTGFDVKGNKNHIDFESLKLQYKGPLDNKGDTNRDENGHGTAVTGTIVGKHGIGVAPGSQIMFFRILDSKLNDAKSKDLRDAIIEACNEGYKIVNVSWGNYHDETGQKRVEDTDEGFLNFLASQGCIVVKSAGNSSYRNSFKFSKRLLDDPILRVGSISSFGHQSSFSSKGEVFAPGGDIFTLYSKDPQKNPPSPKNFCVHQKGRAHGSFVSGTSYSAPFVAGTLGLITAILEKAPGHNRLSFKEQVALKNRILKASEVDKGISAYRSILITDSYVREMQKFGFFYLMTSRNLKKLLEKDQYFYCQETSFTCDESKKDFKKCVENQRDYLARCGHFRRPDMAQNFLENVLYFRNIDVATSYASRLIKKRPSLAKNIVLNIKRLGELYLNIKHNYAHSMEVLDLLKKVYLLEKNPEITKIYMNIFNRMNNELIFSKKLSRSIGRGSDKEIKRILDHLVFIDSHFEKKFSHSYLENLLKGQIAYFGKNLLGLLASIRLQVEAKRRGYRYIVRQSKGINQKIKNILLNKNLKTPEYFTGERPYSETINATNEIYDISPKDILDYLKEIFPKDLESLRQTNGAGFKKLSPSIIISLLSDKEEEENLLGFKYNIFKCLNLGQGWGVSHNLRIFRHITNIYWKRIENETYDNNKKNNLDFFYANILNYVKNYSLYTAVNPKIWDLKIYKKRENDKKVKLYGAKILEYYISKIEQEKYLEAVEVFSLKYFFENQLTRYTDEELKSIRVPQSSIYKYIRGNWSFKSELVLSLKRKIKINTGINSYKIFMQFLDDIYKNVEKKKKEAREKTIFRYKLDILDIVAQILLKDSAIKNFYSRSQEEWKNKLKKIANLYGDDKNFQGLEKWIAQQ